MNKQQIEITYKGMWGVFSHDMYKCHAEDYATGFIAAFDDYNEAIECASKVDGRAIHII